MAKLPRVTAREVVSALEKAGFERARQSGSHAIYIDGAGKRVTVPVHGKRILHPKILKMILRDAGLTVEEFLALSK